jgi:hypothetical protein
MATLLIIALIIYAVVGTASQAEKAERLNKPKCPPHEWYTEEIKDDLGELQGTRLSCRKCGPYSEFLDRQRE